ncbi:MAG: hypothetical protein A3E87_05515 [Gammaproteobacteria bacterium RIFCSPHIGHO2_12_FULL_35_23]|nr:MAG: hypothetical protein A3E87_05515 [Gammaproteobacteria bacterium RIFCSPHIGHO2_12_FULL_35_23]
MADNREKDPMRVQAGQRAAETRGHDSLSEAGKRGAEARNNRLSPEERSEASRRAAQTREEKHPGSLAEAGRKGGQKSHGGGRRRIQDEE